VQTAEQFTPALPSSKAREVLPPGVYAAAAHGVRAPHRKLGFDCNGNGSMQRIATCWIALGLGMQLSACATTVVQQSPIAGDWKLNFGGGKCQELHTYRSDSTGTHRSADEVIETSFHLEFVEKGVYIMRGLVTATNGKNDCTGSPTPVGSRFESVLMFTKGGDFYSCPTLDSMTCNGTGTRIP
jgi:hypothetical protein